MAASRDTGRDRPGAADDSWTVVEVPGDLDFISAPDFARYLDGVAAAGARRLVLDMRDVTFMDSSGLRILLNAARELRERGGALRLAAPDEQVLRLIELTRVGPLLPTYDDVGSASGV